MELSTFTFNGRLSSDMGVYLRRDSDRPAAAPQSRVMQAVPGRRGAYHMGTITGELSIPLGIVLVGGDLVSTRALETAMLAWLITDAACPLEFSEDPGKVYYAMLDGEVRLSRIGPTREGTIAFVAADPARYASTPTSFDVGEGDTTITNPGGLAVPATLDLTFAAPATFVRMQVGAMFCGIGQPPQPTETPFVPESVMLRDDCSAVWGASAIGAPVSGTMGTDGLAVSPMYGGGSFGTGAGWHGPSDEIAFPLVNGSNLAQDFMMSGRFRLDNRVPSNAAQLAAYNKEVHDHGKNSSQAATAKAALNAVNALRSTMGAATLYALSAAGAVIASMSVGDYWAATDKVQASFAVAGMAVPLLVTTGPSATAYNNFDGVLSLSRIGNVLTAKACLIDSNGREVAIRTASWVDAAGVASTPIARVARHFAAWSTVPPVAALNVSQVDVKRINSKPVATDPEHIAEAGDVITFEGWDIRRNGQPYTAPVDFGSDLILLPPGDSTLNIATDGDFDVATATIRPAWL